MNEKTRKSIARQFAEFQCRSADRQTSEHPEYEKMLSCGYGLVGIVREKAERKELYSLSTAGWFDADKTAQRYVFERVTGLKLPTERDQIVQMVTEYVGVEFVEKFQAEVRAEMDAQEGEAPVKPAKKGRKAKSKAEAVVTEASPEVTEELPPGMPRGQYVPELKHLDCVHYQGELLNGDQHDGVAFVRSIETLEAVEQPGLYYALGLWRGRRTVQMVRCEEFDQGHKKLTKKRVDELLAEAETRKAEKEENEPAYV